ncbi:lichenan operon transcriptional antiterminator [Lactobacillus colini]|uniref:Lichenan operon transcriptional antiterminator n=1 Tax=Lactobacillus colini TaxID=1819254 RepID=A0ABS4MFN8_9LACO|nr:PTS sugar transporter subunit IIA [Lactobacillus colini]MBP2058484.1 lichenan operon transcriptional antiterminator [Lactobacillus colini]
MTKKSNLLSFMQQNSDWHTSNELAIEIGVSVRTIKNYINQLRDEGNQIDSSSQGYRFIYSKNNNSPLYEGMNPNSVPSTSDERINYIINYLVNEKSEVNSYDLANQLFVSNTLILQDMKSVQRKVGRFGLSLRRHGDTWTLTGTERQKRSLLGALIYAETSGSFLNQSVIQLNFKNIDVDRIRQTVVDTCNTNNIYLNTFNLNNFILHLVIIIERVKQGNTITTNQSMSTTRNNSVASKIVFTIKEKLGLEFEEADIDELISLLETEINGTHKEKGYSEETALLVSNIIAYIKEVYDIDLASPSFKERFTFHLDRLIKRSRGNSISHNPIAGEVKISSPTIYECAVLIAHRISEKANIQLEDNEIAYIALHVGNAIAEQIEESKKLAVVILMPEYYNNAAIISNKLQNLFVNAINITKIVTDPSQIDISKEKIDMIIAFNANYEIPNITTVHLSQFVLSNDIKRLSVAISDKQHQIKKERFQERLLQFFNPQNFTATDNIVNIDQAFDYITKSFQEENIVNTDYKEKLYQRERMSSTAFGRVAIPHSFEMSAKKSRGFIIINPKGIQWSNGKKVYIVIGLAIDPKNSQLFRDVFDELSEIVTDINNVTKLVKSTNYREFIMNLVNSL